MGRFLMIALACLLVITGIFYVGLESVMENQVERAILEGYPGTQMVEVNMDIEWLAGGLEGEIKNLNIDIQNWQFDKWQINSFQGEFTNVKVNLVQLIGKKTLVVERIKAGKVVSEIDSPNLNKGIKNYYPGFSVQIMEKELKVDLGVTILGKRFNATAYGDLIPATGAAVAFKPTALNVAGYKITGVIKEKILNNLKFKFVLEKIPFHFQVTTVNILQDKILIKGSI